VTERRTGSSFSEEHKPEPFFPGTGITNTTPLPPNFGSLFAFQNLFQKKNNVGWLSIFSSTPPLKRYLGLIVFSSLEVRGHISFLYIPQMTHKVV
jgi:hypothetical protein